MKRFVLLFLLLLICVGCGDGRPKRYPVQGQLLLDGKPAEVPEGFVGVAAITFHPVAGGRDAYANLKSDGTFEVGNYETADGIPLGEFKVAVQFYRLEGSTKRTKIPLFYEDYEKSGLHVTIDRETKNLTLEVKSR